MGATKVTSIVLISVILTAIIVAMANVGTSIFMDRPDYSDYRNSTCEVDDHTCMPDYNYEEYDEAMKDFNQNRFYIFTGVGFLLLLLGLFLAEPIIKFTGLASGLILVIQSLVFNWENKIIVFGVLSAILIIFGYLGIKVVRKMK